MKRSFALAALTLVSGCDGGKTETMQLTVQSTPSVYSSPTTLGGRVYLFGVNVAPENTFHIVESNKCDLGFEPDWGITYKIAVEYYVDRPFIGSCPPIRYFNGIVEMIPDDFGTRYYNYAGSGWGGMFITKEKDQEPWFKVGGYGRPIYCVTPECDRMKAGDTFYISRPHVRAFFELVEIDGKRELELKIE